MTYPVETVSKLTLRRQGENRAMRVVFDFSAWKERYGDGGISLVNQRPGESTPYFVPLTVDGTLAIWDVSDTDTERPSKNAPGFCQLLYRAGDEVVAKSQVIRTVIESSLGAAEDAPEPSEAWLDAVLKASSAALGAAERAEIAANAIEDMTDTATGESQTVDMTRADQPTQVGTALNTANLLSETAAAIMKTAFGDEPETPSEAFETLTNGIVQRITGGTTELTPGVSKLASGTLYVVYK